MSNKDNENKNSQFFSEDITKKLVKKILDDDITDDDDTMDSKPDFNIEYESYDDSFDKDYDDYDDDYDDEDDDYDDEDDFRKAPSKKMKNKHHKNHYRKNIEIYGKDFFDDDYQDGYDESPSLIGRVICYSIIVVLTISTAFLSFKVISMKRELTNAKAQIDELVDNKVATEAKLMEDSLKNEIEQLKQENERLKGTSSQSPSKTTSETSSEESSKTTTTNNNNSNSNSNNSPSSEYIVKEGDVIWNISKKVYGNGSHYQKILDANGLKENSVLKPGEKLIIPKLN